MTITVYGIKNCDTMKKARAWLDQGGVDYAFHDYRTAGIEPERLERWCRKVGWEALLNRAGTTFRKLPEKDQSNIDTAKAVALMLAQPSMISDRCSTSAAGSCWSDSSRNCTRRRWRSAE